MELRLLGKRRWRCRLCKIKQVPVSGATEQSRACLNSRFWKFGTHVILFFFFPGAFRSFASTNFLLRELAEFPCRESADLIGPGNEITNGIVDPSASHQLLSVCSLDVPRWIHIQMEPV